ncbi:MAG: cyclase family protein [Candidatus Dormibacterales bacterium]
MQPTPPDDPLGEYIRRFSNWGRWGPEDGRGTTNHITPDKVKAAAALVTRGQVISLALNFDQRGPQTGANGRFNCLRYSVATGTDHVQGLQRWGGQPLPRGFGYADDSVVLHLQSATHWDGLAHIFHEGRMYNGHPAQEVGANGAPRNGIEHLKSTLVGRGVLLDMARYKGVEGLEDGEPVTVEDLEGAAALEGVEVKEGDIVLLRTGQMARCLLRGWGAYAGGDAPGLSLGAVPWLAEKRIAALATDTWGVEVRPNELPDSFQPMHIVTVVYMGLLLGEMFNLEELAQACAADRGYEFMVSAPPLPFTGSVGAPPGPVAIR